MQQEEMLEFLSKYSFVFVLNCPIDNMSPMVLSSYITNQYYMLLHMAHDDKERGSKSEFTKDTVPVVGKPPDVYYEWWRENLRDNIV